MIEPPKQDSPTSSHIAHSQRPAVSPLVKVFASALFSGYAPFASGTVGTLVGIIFYFIPSFEETAILLPACAIVFVLGSLAADKMERAYGHDPSVVTIDEVLGIWVSLLLLPKSYLIIAAAFFLFRAFDVFKPWPARVFDKMHGGWNIMLDDVVAGLYTNIILQIAIRIF
ncbi:MAG: phosphatidylglycerophosphatase A [Bacteroidota bacterium]